MNTSSEGVDFSRGGIKHLSGTWRQQTARAWQTSDRNQIPDIKIQAVHKGPREGFQFIFSDDITFVPT